MDSNKKYVSYSARLPEYKKMVELLKIERMVNIMISEHQRKEEKELKKVLIYKEDKKC